MERTYSKTSLELLQADDWINIFEPSSKEEFKKASNVSQTGRRHWGSCCRGIIMFLVPVLVFTSAVVTKLGSVVLAREASKPLTIIDEAESEVSDDATTLQTLAIAYAWILISLIAPSVINSIFSLMTSSAREMKYPTKTLVTLALLSGIFEGIGVSILSVAVLGRLSLLSGISVMLAIVPFSSFGEFLNRLMSKSKRGLLVLGIALSVCCLGAMVYFNGNYSLAYLIPLSLLCIGYTFWSKNSPLKLKELKCFYYIGFLRSFVQIPTIVLSIWVIWILEGHDAASFWTLGFPGLGDESQSLIAGLCVVFGSFIVYHFGWMACSLCFQKIGFAAPLAVSSIAAYGIIFGVCWGTSENCVENSDFYWEVPIFLVLFIIQTLISRHVWYENIFPIPIQKALWSRTGYFSVGCEQFLLMNRREKALRFEVKRNQSQESLPTVFTNDSSSSSFGVEDVRTITSCNTKNETNHVFMCTTMWHENTKEMHHLLHSYLRVDAGRLETDDRTIYEGHLLFDDAVTPEGAYNEYVNCFLSLLPSDIPSIKEFITPYGYQLLITLPHGMKIYMHLKDKTKIRNKKRWSQIMYMFYILRFRVITSGLDINNVFILTTDGDTEFDMPSTRDLLLYLKRNHNVGGVCSRVFPKGGGPVAWFQVFEYAVGHWLQKAAENVLGSVLCLPGCFSMLRGTAVEEVMHTYTTNAETGKEFLQYDQGEDRWLSTLILKHGWLLQYAASADAYTYCPSTFNEFFNQRRRWVSSTIANLVDLIMNSSAVVKKNIAISHFFMIYQAMLLFGTLISPGIILMMMGAGLNAGFGIHQAWVSITFLIVTIVYAIICLKTTSDTQINIAWVCSLFGGIVMIFVMVGFVITVADDPTTLSSSFVLFLVGTMIFTALLHPRESYCLISGIVYLFALPSVFIFLMVYSVANIDNVSWGTREGKTQNAQQDKVKTARQFFTKLKFWKKKEPEDETLIIKDSTDSLQLEKSNGKSDQKEFPSQENRKLSFKRATSSPLLSNSVNINTTYHDIDFQEEREELLARISKKETVHEFKLIETAENTFWEMLINKYLEVEKPTPTNLAKKNQILEMLRELRDSSLFSLILINTIIVFLFLAVYGQASLIILDSSAVTLILSIFAVLVLLQFLGMIWHRFSTVMHVVATANKYDIDANRKKRLEKRQKKQIRKVTQRELEQNEKQNTEAKLQASPENIQQDQNENSQRQQSSTGIESDENFIEQFSDQV